MSSSSQYVVDTRHAAEILISGAYGEEAELQKISEALHSAQAELKSLYRHVEFSNLNPDLDDDGIGTSARWEAHFDVGPKADRLQEQVARLQQSIADKQFSAGVLAGGLLQIAKQGISDAYGGLDTCPPGRNVGSQCLKSVIWQGRNQSMHYEEGHLSPNVVTCFETLFADFGGDFRTPLTRNLALDVVKVLGWSDLKQFEADLTSILQ
jgi:hypothetical protein